MSEDHLKVFDENGIQVKDCPGKGCFPKGDIRWYREKYDQSPECEHGAATYGIDWLGNKIELGDEVIYAQMSGRCVQMVKGTVTKITFNHWAIMPNGGNRWESHKQYPKRFNTKTGKFLNDKQLEAHVKEECYYTDLNGNRFAYEEVYSSTGHPVAGLSTHAWARDWEWRQSLTYHPTVYQDWIIEKVPDQKPVTIQITNNIILHKKKS